MSALWSIVQAHLDTWGVREAEVARRMGSSPQTLNSWKNRGVKKLPEARLLAALSDVTGTPYMSVLYAALHDTHYLPEEAVRAETRKDRTNGTQAPISQAAGSAASEDDGFTPTVEYDAPPVLLQPEESDARGHVPDRQG